ncbi:alpha/beta hydrolase [Acinetobacter sp. ANC 3903]|jgi:acetyl esterase/lipase|uniref:alpha/beta hydrolase n=1 Tax=Acinetobacter sp. ANC 3903 TaxID=1977883 RepID=UPI000A337E04|nr:alpha/beta hydrolase [Acinetobacter sp. ANC 3903]OTG62541.1 alpha/beta hydrolase [Acinetobacter sp. ANC 3903]
MLNKVVQAVRKEIQQKVEKAKILYKDFRLYDFGSYALNRLTPRKGYTLHENIAYGLKARQRFDIFSAASPLEQRPLIVFVHGGAWLHGDKKDYRFVGEAFAKEGYDVAVINYHLAPEHVFPSYIDDLSLALNYLTQHQSRLNIRTEKIVLMGHSAGAFNIMSALYHPHPYSLQCRSQIRAIIGLSGPYHFDYKDDPLCADAFDQSVPYQQVMPYYFVESNQVRHYLFLASNDQVVGHSNSQDLHRILQEKGNHSQMITIPGTGHVSIMGSVSSLFSRYFQTKQQILIVLEEALKP